MIRVNDDWVIMVDQYSYTPVRDSHRTKTVVQDDGTEKTEQVCPACYRDIPLEPIDHSMTTYCIYCGQAINWEEWKYGQC